MSNLSANNEESGDIEDAVGRPCGKRHFTAISDNDNYERWPDAAATVVVAAAPTTTTTTTAAAEAVPYQRTVVPSRRTYSATQLARIYKHTDFGCMGNDPETHTNSVTHVNPVHECRHKCRYCYVNGYFHWKTTDYVPIVLDTSMPDLAASATQKFRNLRASTGRIPELHFSISTDILQVWSFFFLFFSLSLAHMLTPDAVEKNRTTQRCKRRRSR